MGVIGAIHVHCRGQCSASFTIILSHQGLYHCICYYYFITYDYMNEICPCRHPLILELFYFLLLDLLCYFKMNIQLSFGHRLILLLLLLCIYCTENNKSTTITLQIMFYLFLKIYYIKFHISCILKYYFCTTSIIIELIPS